MAKGVRKQSLKSYKKKRAAATKKANRVNKAKRLSAAGRSATARNKSARIKQGLGPIFSFEKGYPKSHMKSNMKKK